MEPDQIDAIAEAVCKKLESNRQQWWVEPELHYNQHKAIDELLTEYKEMRSMFWRIFFRCITAGAVVLAFVGVNINTLSKYLPK